MTDYRQQGVSAVRTPKTKKATEENLCGQFGRMLLMQRRRPNHTLKTQIHQDNFHQYRRNYRCKQGQQGGLFERHRKPSLLYLQLFAAILLLSRQENAPYMLLV